MAQAEAIVREFREQLDALARTYRGRPEAELDALWLVGLEREAIVSIAYRGPVIADRLARLPIDDDARSVIERAIRWAWRDEQAHTLWVRGALLQRGGVRRRVRAFTAQLEGRVGGWVSSRQNHYTWREAPVRRLVAEAIEMLGGLGGRIPPAVRATLHWNRFGDVCRFNLAAETTAAMAWRRMAELATAPAEAEGFAWMASDEERHARIFAILADAFDADDRLTITAGELRARVQEVGQRFVARPDADRPSWRNPLGKGGTVVVREGEAADDVVASVLERCGVGELLRGDRPPVVAIKTTFMLVTDRRDRSPGVSPAILDATIAWLRARGAIVEVIDARNLYDRFHTHRSVAEVAGYLGIRGPIVDAQRDQVPHDYRRGGALHTISRAWRDADVRLLLGKLRSHPTSVALLSLDSCEGLATRPDDHLFTDRRAERETAMLMTVDAFPPHAALLDAWQDVPDGLLGVFGDDQPLQPRRVYGSRDALALDAVACRHIGADPADTLIEQALDWFGDPRGTTTVDGRDAPIAGFRLPARGARTSLLVAAARPVFTHASFRGALFLPRFDDAAFPPVAPAPTVLRAARGVVRRIVDDRATRPREEPLATTAIAVDGHPVRLARLGAGPPVVMLHGYPDTLQVWAPVARRLAGRHEVIAFDWPGLGGSERRAGAATPQALAEHLRAVLDATGLDRVDLVGADMGAPPALVFAARYPDRVGTVVASNSLLFGDAATSLEIRIMRRAGLAALAFERAPALVYTRCKQTFLPPGYAPPAAIDADFARAFARPDVRAQIARMCVDYEHALPHLPEDYWRIRRPLRLLWAERDRHFAVDHARRMCALVPGSRLAVLPGATHWMALARAPQVAAQLDAWLA